MTITEVSKRDHTKVSPAETFSKTEVFPPRWALRTAHKLETNLFQLLINWYNCILYFMENGCTLSPMWSDQCWLSAPPGTRPAGTRPAGTPEHPLTSHGLRLQHCHLPAAKLQTRCLQTSKAATTWVILLWGRKLAFFFFQQTDSNKLRLGNGDH